MVGRKLHIIAVDPETGEVAWHCPGPDARGACRRVAIGAEMPCIGKALTIVGSDDDAYVVAPHMTLCPLTLALAMGTSMGRSHERQEACVA
jgi:hypothetical protein